MKIFIGSSRERSDLVAEIAVWLEEQDHEPMPWYTPGLFGVGDQTFKTLVEISRTVQAAVFVFSPDDQVWYRGDTLAQPRDNILIEYGLFAGALGPNKAAICRDGGARHATDLVGLTYIDVSEKRRSRGKLELTIWARKLSSAAPVDPVVIKHQAKIFELEKNLAELEARYEFEREKGKGLESILSREKVVDFFTYNLSTDGHWKLLYNFNYFHVVAATIAQQVDNPVELRQFVVRCGAEAMANNLAWLAPGNKQKPDMSSDRIIFITRKLLRQFRDSPDPRQYLNFVDKLPRETRDQIDRAANDSIGSMGRMNEK